jgi:hypothetical protein
MNVQERQEMILNRKGAKAQRKTEGKILTNKPDLLMNFFAPSRLCGSHFLAL